VEIIINIKKNYKFKIVIPNLFVLKILSAALKTIFVSYNCYFYSLSIDFVVPTVTSKVSTAHLSSNHSVVVVAGAVVVLDV
jgi:hypothetical protein